MTLTNDSRLSRRTLLGHLAVLAGVGAVGLGGCSRVDAEALAAAVVELSPDPAAARAIGEVFLADRPDSTRQQLANRLAIELDWRPELDRAALGERLLTRIERDFRDGKTLRVDGWVLAQTEVWWAALVALA